MSIKKAGFTIVELLIVIIVIAILAAISIVSYNSILDRARNAKTVSMVNQWEKMLALYTVETGGYPTGSTEYVCLGTDFAASEPFVSGQCMVAPTWGVSVDNALMDAIEQATGAITPSSQLDTVSFVDGNGDRQHYRGLLYLSRNGGAGITYILKGNSSQCTNGDGFFELGGYVACRRVLHGNPYQGL